MVTNDSPAGFRGLADPTRRQILELLRAGELPVNEIARHFPMSRPAISKHLRILREEGIVTETRQGRERVYHLVPEPLESVSEWLQELLAGAPARRPPPRPAPPPNDWQVW